MADFRFSRSVCVKIQAFKNSLANSVKTTCFLIVFLYQQEDHCDPSSDPSSSHHKHSSQQFLRLKNTNFVSCWWVTARRTCRKLADTSWGDCCLAGEGWVWHVSSACPGSVRTTLEASQCSTWLKVITRAAFLGLGVLWDLWALLWMGRWVCPLCPGKSLSGFTPCQPQGAERLPLNKLRARPLSWGWMGVWGL